MSSFTGLSPNNPRDYVGPNVALNTVVTRNRAPTGADYRQPETGKLYPFNTFWLVGKNPTSGTQGDLWYLSKIAANVAYWVKLSGSSISPLLTVTVQSLTAPGVNPVDSDINGNVNFNGAVVANHSVPVETRTRALNTFNLELQYATTSAATDGTKSGISHYNSAQFIVDAFGFVSIIPGSLSFTSVNVQRFSTPGAFTYTPTAGTAYAIVEMLGAGAGGAGVANGSMQQTEAGGGAGGGYCKFLLSSAQIGASKAGVIGAKGAGGAAGAGATGAA